MKLYKVCFKKRYKGKMHAMFHAAGWRRNGDLVELFDDAGIVLQRYSVLDLKAPPFIFNDEDDPLGAVLPQ